MGVSFWSWHSLLTRERRKQRLPKGDQKEGTKGKAQGSVGGTFSEWIGQETFLLSAKLAF